MVNIQGELNSLAMDIVKLIQNQLVTKKLVDTGKLLHSIKCKFIKTTNGYVFKIEAMDYFTYLDNKHHIIDDALKSSEFKNIQDKLADIFVQQLLEEL